MCTSAEKIYNAYSLNSVGEIFNNVAISVDLRMELLSIVMCLCDNNLITSLPIIYKDEVIREFSGHRNHQIVNCFRELGSRGFNYAAPVKLMLYLSDDFELCKDMVMDEFILWRIGGEENLTAFIKLLKQFAQDTSFYEFYKKNNSFYKEMIEDLLKQVDLIKLIDSINHFYKIEKTSYNFILTSLFGYLGFGSLIEQGEESHVYSIIGTFYEKSGKSFFDKGFENMAIHEISHSFINPLTDKYWDVIKDSPVIHRLPDTDARITDDIGAKEWINECLIRALTIILTCNEKIKMKSLIKYEEIKGFDGIQKVVKKMEEYKENIECHKNFEAFYLDVIRAME